MSNRPDPTPQPTARVATVETANGPLTCTIWSGANDRPAAVLVHGVNGSAASWATLVERVAGRRTLVAVDLRGRGASPAHGPWGISAHGQDVAQVVTALPGLVDGGEAGAAPVTLVAHSFGAHVAAAAAGPGRDLASDRVAELILVDGGPPRRLPADGGPQAAIDGALGNILPHLDSLPFPVSAEAVAADFASMIHDGTDQDLSTCLLAATTQPLTLIRAGHGMAPGLDPIIDDELIAALAEARAAGGPIDSPVVAEATHFSLLGDHIEPLVQAIVARPR